MIFGCGTAERTLSARWYRPYKIRQCGVGIYAFAFYHTFSRLLFLVSAYIWISSA